MIEDRWPRKLALLENKLMRDGEPPEPFALLLLLELELPLELTEVGARVVVDGEL